MELEDHFKVELEDEWMEEVMQSLTKHLKAVGKDQLPLSLD